MAFINISHKVKDYATWRPFFDKDEPRRLSAGVKTHHVFRSMSDPNDIHILMEAADVSVMEKLFSDPAMPKIMEEAGVIGQPVVQMFQKA